MSEPTSYNLGALSFDIIASTAAVDTAIAAAKEKLDELGSYAEQRRVNPGASPPSTPLGGKPGSPAGTVAMPVAMDAKAAFVAIEAIEKQALEAAARIAAAMSKAMAPVGRAVEGAAPPAPGRKRSPRAVVAPPPMAEPASLLRPPTEEEMAGVAALTGKPLAMPKPMAPAAEGGFSTAPIPGGFTTMAPPAAVPSSPESQLKSYPARLSELNTQTKQWWLAGENWPSKAGLETSAIRGSRIMPLGYGGGSSVLGRGEQPPSMWGQIAASSDIQKLVEQEALQRQQTRQRERNLYLPDPATAMAPPPPAAPLPPMPTVPPKLFAGAKKYPGADRESVSGLEKAYFRAAEVGREIRFTPGSIGASRVSSSAFARGAGRELEIETGQRMTEATDVLVEATIRGIGKATRAAADKVRNVARDDVADMDATIKGYSATQSGMKLRAVPLSSSLEGQLAFTLQRAIDKAGSAVSGDKAAMAPLAMGKIAKDEVRMDRAIGDAAGDMDPSWRAAVPPRLRPHLTTRKGPLIVSEFGKGGVSPELPDDELAALKDAVLRELPSARRPSFGAPPGRATPAGPAGSAEPAPTGRVTTASGRWMATSDPAIWMDTKTRQLVDAATGRSPAYGGRRGGPVLEGADLAAMREEVAWAPPGGAASAPPAAGSPPAAGGKPFDAGAKRSPWTEPIGGRGRGYGMYMNLMFGGWEVGQVMKAKKAAEIQLAEAFTPEEQLVAGKALRESAQQGIFGQAIFGVSSLIQPLFEAKGSGLEKLTGLATLAATGWGGYKLGSMIGKPIGGMVAQAAWGQAGSAASAIAAGKYVARGFGIAGTAATIAAELMVAINQSVIEQREAEARTATQFVNLGIPAIQQTAAMRKQRDVIGGTEYQNALLAMERRQSQTVGEAAANRGLAMHAGRMADTATNQGQVTRLQGWTDALGITDSFGKFQAIGSRELVAGNIFAAQQKEIDKFNIAERDELQRKAWQLASVSAMERSLAVGMAERDERLAGIGFTSAGRREARQIEIEKMELEAKAATDTAITRLGPPPKGFSSDPSILSQDPGFMLYEEQRQRIAAEARQSKATIDRARRVAREADRVESIQISADIVASRYRMAGGEAEAERVQLEASLAQLDPAQRTQRLAEFDDLRRRRLDQARMISVGADYAAQMKPLDERIERLWSLVYSGNREKDPYTRGRLQMSLEEATLQRKALSDDMEMRQRQANLMLDRQPLAAQLAPMKKQEETLEKLAADSTLTDRDREYYRKQLDLVRTQRQGIEREQQDRVRDTVTGMKIEAAALATERQGQGMPMLAAAQRLGWGIEADFDRMNRSSETREIGRQRLLLGREELKNFVRTLERQSEMSGARELAKPLWMDLTGTASSQQDRDADMLKAMQSAAEYLKKIEEYLGKIGIT